MSTSNIAVIGDKDSVFCFNAVGVDVFPVSNVAEARQAFEQTYRGGYSIIFITEAFAARLEDRLQELAWEPLPSVVLIPDNRGSRGLGLTKVRETVKKAVGADLFAETQERE